jgi:hypothetical protein
VKFPIRFTGLNRYLWLLGTRPSRSWVEVTESRLRVRLDWGFRLDAPRAAVQAAAPDDRPVRAWGAHGWRGRWLVNGSSSGVVRIDLYPPMRAAVLWLLRPRVRELRVAVDDPAGLIAALDRAPVGSPAGGGSGPAAAGPG